jgi:hypothetical protein
MQIYHFILKSKDPYQEFRKWLHIKVDRDQISPIFFYLLF